MSRPPLTEEDLYRAKPRGMAPEHLIVWMLWHHMSQTSVATATRVNRRTVYNWINGKHSIPRTVWPSLAQQFGAPLPPHIGPYH